MKDKLYFYKAFCYNCVDGDTIDINIDLGFNLEHKKARVRLLYINSPEKNRVASKKAGLAAKTYLESIILNKTIYIHSTKWDHFGRILGQIFTEDGKDVSALVLESGHAVPYRSEAKKSK